MNLNRRNHYLMISLFLMAFVSFLVLTPEAEASRFTDLEKFPWAEEQINYLADKEIVNGYDAKTFGPEDDITRGQAAVMIVNALYKETIATRQNQFSDILPAKYYANAVNVAAEKNIVSGYPDGTFRPENPITRAESSVMIDKAFPINFGERRVDFTDSRNFNSWAKDSIERLASAGVISGYPDDTFRPNNKINRAEFAVILARALDPQFIPPLKVAPDPHTVNVPDNAALFEAEVVKLTNQERTARGLEPLEVDERLSEVARLKSDDMLQRNYFDHISPTYGSPFEMMSQFGIDYNGAGENIAAGYPTPETVVDGWMNSSGHRENMLRDYYTHIGVGYVKGNSGYHTYWTQMFILK